MPHLRSPDSARSPRWVPTWRRIIRRCCRGRCRSGNWENCWALTARTRSGPAHGSRPRKLLVNRKWSPATMAALHVAREAIADAGWTADDLRDAALVVGTSRGNAAGWLGPWPGRRPFKLMAASNTIHSEPASAITIEFGITGPNHVLASGCAAGLDAVGIAMMLVRSGAAPRALAVAVDLPLVPVLLDNYAASGLLAAGMDLDPYHPGHLRLHPRRRRGGDGHRIQGRRISPACPLRLQCRRMRSGGHSRRRRTHAGACWKRPSVSTGHPSAVCPHATGTAVQAVADPAVLSRCFPGHAAHLASAEAVHRTHHRRERLVGERDPRPVSERRQTAAEPAWTITPPRLPPSRRSLEATGPIYKLSHGMGGHNALLVLTPP